MGRSFAPSALVLLLALAPLDAQTPTTGTNKPSATATKGTTPASSTPITSTTPTLREPTDAEVAAAAGLGIGGLVCIGVCVLLGIILTALPIVIAAMRGHPNTAAIAAVTILLGWTGIGWIAALIWSFTAIDADRRYR